MEGNKIFILVVGFIVITVGVVFLISTDKDETNVATDNASLVNDNDVEDASDVVGEAVNEPENTESATGDGISDLPDVDGGKVEDNVDTAQVEPDEATTHVINVEGENFSFNVKEIRVKVGDTVTINFKSVGGFHDWTIDKFAASAERVSEGGTSSVTFVANTAGTYEYYCSVGNHRALGMVGSLIVE